MAKTRMLDKDMHYHILFGSKTLMHDIWLDQEYTNADDSDFDIEISSKIVQNYRPHTRLKNINKVTVGLMRDEIIGIDKYILRFLNKGEQIIAYTYFNDYNIFHFFTRNLRIRWRDDDGKEHEKIVHDNFLCEK